MEEEKRIDSKVMAFGLLAIAFVVVGICVGLAVMLWGATDRYAEQVRIVAEKEKTIAEQREVIHTLQRTLDRTEGKMSVYEDYLVKRNRDVAQAVIVRYLKTQRKSSEKTTIKDLEEWLTGYSRGYTGVGGP